VDFRCDCIGSMIRRNRSYDELTFRRAKCCTFNPASAHLVRVGRGYLCKAGEGNGRAGEASGEAVARAQPPIHQRLPLRRLARDHEGVQLACGGDAVAAEMLRGGG
jgi:hypothetical protein